MPNPNYTYPIDIQSNNPTGRSQYQQQQQINPIDNNDTSDYKPTAIGKIIVDCIDIETNKVLPFNGIISLYDPDNCPRSFTNFVIHTQSQLLRFLEVNPSPNFSKFKVSYNIQSNEADKPITASQSALNEVAPSLKLDQQTQQQTTQLPRKRKSWESDIFINIFLDGKTGNNRIIRKPVGSLGIQRAKAKVGTGEELIFALVDYCLNNGKPFDFIQQYVQLSVRNIELYDFSEPENINDFFDLT
jgi:hypothetical protein